MKPPSKLSHYKSKSFNTWRYSIENSDDSPIECIPEEIVTYRETHRGKVKFKEDDEEWLLSEVTSLNSWVSVAEEHDLSNEKPNRRFFTSRDGVNTSFSLSSSESSQIFLTPRNNEVHTIETYPQRKQRRHTAPVESIKTALIRLGNGHIERRHLHNPPCISTCQPNKSCVRTRSLNHHTETASGYISPKFSRQLTQHVYDESMDHSPPQNTCLNRFFPFHTKQFRDRNSGSILFKSKRSLQIKPRRISCPAVIDVAAAKIER